MLNSRFDWSFQTQPLGAAGDAAPEERVRAAAAHDVLPATALRQVHERGGAHQGGPKPPQGLRGLLQGGLSSV